jgi:thymidine kinase
MSVTVLCGPMASGKTERLIDALNAAEARGRTVLCFNHKLDTRYSDATFVTSRTGARRQGIAVECLGVANLCVPSDRRCVIGVDEGQFMPDLDTVVQQWADAGHTVFVAALDTNFERRPFGKVGALLAIADLVQKCTATCDECQGNAQWTRRRDPSVRDEVLVGGDDVYSPVCRACYNVPNSVASKSE